MCHHASQFVLISQTVAEIWLFFDFGLFFFGGGLPCPVTLTLTFNPGELWSRPIHMQNINVKSQPVQNKRTDGHD